MIFVLDYGHSSSGECYLHSLSVRIVDAGVTNNVEFHWSKRNTKMEEKKTEAEEKNCAM